MKDASAILFDWDGTLVDSFTFLLNAHAHACEQLGRHIITKDEFTQYFGKPREILYTELYGAENFDAAKGHFEAYVTENHMKELEQMPGAADLLKTIHEMGIPMGVVSNKRGFLIEQEAAHYGWDRYFSVVVGAGEAEADKPSPAPLTLCIEKMELSTEKSKIYYVGDTVNDLLAAQNGGYPAILIGEGSDAEALNSKHTPKYFFKNCGEMSRFLLQSA